MPVTVESGLTGPFIPNGVTTAFAFTFKADSASEVIVVDEDGVALSPALYSVELNSGEGGTVTFSVAPALADYPEIYIVSDPAMTQGSDFGNAGPSFNPASITRAFDRAAIRDLALKADLDRAIKVPFGASSATLPENRAGKYLSFDVNGDPIASTGTGADAGLREDLAEPNGATLLGIQHPGTGSVPATVRDKLNMFISAERDFGVSFNDTGDQASKLQAAINASDQFRVPLKLHTASATANPTTIARIGTPLDLKGRYVDIEGQAARTQIKAIAPMARIFDVGETSELVYSAFRLANVALDGNNMLTSEAIYIRYRREYMLEMVVAGRSPCGFREKDTNTSSHLRCRSIDNAIGWHLVGSNHSSHWDRCSFLGATDTHLKIEANGTANDGNLALLFSNCDVESGGTDGVGVTIAEGCEVVFNGCYLGEGLKSDVIRNAGHTKIKGGALFFGNEADTYLARPLGGRLMIDGAVLNGQTNADFQRLINLTSDEITAGNGKIAFQNMLSNFPTTPQVIVGDFLDYIPGKAFAPRLGRSYAATSFDGTVTSTVSGNSVTGTVTSAGAGALMAISANLEGDWRYGEEVYLAVVYTASKALSARLAESPYGTAYSIVTLPAGASVRTMVKVGSIPSAGAWAKLEFLMSSVVNGDTATIHKVALCDSSWLRNSDGVMGQFGLIA